MLSWVHEALPYVQHYTHAAGVSGFSLLRDITPQEFKAVADPKASPGTGGISVASKHDLPAATCRCCPNTPLTRWG